jgi:hypothetical protein
MSLAVDDNKSGDSDHQDTMPLNSPESEAEQTLHEREQSLHEREQALLLREAEVLKMKEHAEAARHALAEERKHEITMSGSTAASVGSSPRASATSSSINNNPSGGSPVHPTPSNTTVTSVAQASDKTKSTVTLAQQAKRLKLRVQELQLRAMEILLKENNIEFKLCQTEMIQTEGGIIHFIGYTKPAVIKAGIHMSLCIFTIMQKLKTAQIYLRRPELRKLNIIQWNIPEKPFTNQDKKLSLSEEEHIQR